MLSALNLQLKNSYLYKISENPLFIGFSIAFFVIPIRVLVSLAFNFSDDDYLQIQGFIEWFGVPYGLLIALVLVNVWTKYDSVEKEFDREIDAIELLHGTIFLLDKTKFKNQKKQIVLLIKLYVSHVISELSSENRVQMKKIGDSILREIRDAMYKIFHNKEESTISTELLRLINEALDVRGDRISRAKLRMPSTVRWLSLAASFIWVVPFLSLNFDNGNLGIVVTFGVVLVVVSLLEIIKDLDDPYKGTWKIDIQDWIELKKKLNKQ